MVAQSSFLLEGEGAICVVSYSTIFFILFVCFHGSRMFGLQELQGSIGHSLTNILKTSISFTKGNAPKIITCGELESLSLSSSFYCLKHPSGK